MSKLLAQGHSLCAGCGNGIAMNLVSRAAPDNLIVACATSCMEVTTSFYPQTAWKVPWIHSAFENVSAMASGIEAAIKKTGKDWKVLAVAGDGGTFDIGFQALSGMIERGHEITQVCLDNECYANTGVQRSGATPYGAWTTTTPAGKVRYKKPIVEIVAAHRIPYAATASIAYPQDLIAKMKKAFENQPSFVHIQCPCPTGWKFDVSQTVKIARAAVETGMWALYEIDGGVFRFTKRITERKPVGDYLKSQGRFRHLSDREIEKIQEMVDKRWKELENFEKCETKLLF